MKRLFCIVIFTAIILGITSCAKSQAESIYISNISETNSPKPTSDTAVSENEHKFNINFFGDSKAIFALSDDNVNKILDDINSENTKYNIGINFFKKNSQFLSVGLNYYGWSINPVSALSEDGMPEWYVSGQADTYIITGNTLSFEINKSGIRQLIEECDNYSITFMDYTINDGLSDTIESGSVSEILTQEQFNNGIKITYVTDEKMIVRVYGEVFENNLKDNEFNEIVLNFYLSEGNGFIPDYKLSLTTNYATGISAQLMQMNYKIIDEQNRTIDSTEIIGSKYNEFIKTDVGYSAQVFSEDIKSLFSDCQYIDVTDGKETIYFTEKYSDAIEKGTITIPPIPDVFPVNANDESYFYPVTDDYIIIKIDYPEAAFFDYGFAVADGIEVYAPIMTHISPLQIVSVTSYDEFGIADQKTKIIYDNITDAMTAPSDRLDWFLKSDLTGDDEKDKRILADFHDGIDQNIFSTTHSGNTLYKYFGHFDNVRYFSGVPEDIRNVTLKPIFPVYDQSSTFDGDGFLKEDIEYAYEFANFEINLSQVHNSVSHFTAYHSKAKAMTEETQ